MREDFFEEDFFEDDTDQSLDPITQSIHKYVKECIDKLNHTFLTLKFCIWNISHVFIFFIYCLILKPVTFYDHLFIFMIGVIWYLMQYFTRKDTIGNIQKCLNVAYDNMLHPRLDDFIYNILGQMLYICYIYFK